MIIDSESTVTALYLYEFFYLYLVRYSTGDMFSIIADILMQMIGKIYREVYVRL